MKKLVRLFSSIFYSAMILGIVSCNSGVGNKNPTYVGTKAPTQEKAVGDVIFNDGSFTPLSEINARTENDSETGLKLTKVEQDAAVALIFYKGTECSDEPNPEERTLGIGLKISDEREWSENGAQTGTLGIEMTSGWTGTENVFYCNSSKNGKNNYSVLVENLNDKSKAGMYTAFGFAQSYSSIYATNLQGDFTSGWYLPNCLELFKFSEYYDKNDISNVIPDFPDRCYFWSSSTDGPNNITVVFFEKGDSGLACSDRNEKSYTCAIREF